MQVNQLISNLDNPRTIRGSKFEKLKKSIKDFPDMMALRPIVIDESNTVLGGNMRLKALIALGYTEIPENWVIQAKDLTDEQKKEFIIKDNVSFGEWDYEALANQWEAELLNPWGVDVPKWDNTDAYEPELQPQTKYQDVTAEQVKKEATILANKMLREQTLKDVICPQCGEEFSIQ